jgi:hypothetical protein
MKTKIIKYLSILILSQIASCKENTGFPDYKTNFTLAVIDADNGSAIEGVDTTIVYFHANPKLIYEHQGKTNLLGKYTAEDYSIGVFVAEAQKKGYYSAFSDEIRFKTAKHMAPQKVDFSMSLRKIIHPIPLYAKQNNIPFPESDKWIGFDLEKADWVKPFGSGIVSDVDFLISTRHLEAETINGKSGISRVDEIKELHKSNPRNKAGFLESRDKFFNLKKGTSTYEQSILFRMHPWQGIVKMRVPGLKGGIIAEKEKYFIHSKSPQVDYINDIAPEMRLPHNAPKNGYLQEYKWEKSTQNGSLIDEKLGFFLKTRVRLDENGNEISAHYAKFITDLEIDIRGRIKFTSYFNPTANDTNLEFDLKKNLFLNLKDNEKPYLP